MRCLACKNLFRVKTTWQNLFMQNNYYLCDECQIKYKAQFTYVAIPFKKLIHVFSVFDKIYEVNPVSFILERKVLFEFISKKYNLNKVTFLYFDSFKELLENEKKIDILSLFNNDIIVMLTYFSKF